MSLRVRRRRWFYLNGYFMDPKTGERSTNPGNSMFPGSAWNEYDAHVSYLLGDQYEALGLAQFGQGPADSTTQMLDLESFTDPPLCYSIWKGHAVTVRNPRAPAALRGTETVAGFDAKFWRYLENHPHATKMLPSDVASLVDMGICKLIGGLYQIHNDSLGLLETYQRYLADLSGTAPLTQMPRVRIVMMIEYPLGYHEMGMGYQQGISPPQMVSSGEGEAGGLGAAAARGGERGGEGGTAGAAAGTGGAGGGGSAAEAKVVFEGAPPVYEWWYGDRPPQDELAGIKPRGFWKRYHPTVCRKLEAAWQGDPAFQSGQAPTDVDGVMYMVQRVLSGQPWTGPLASEAAAAADGVSFPPAPPALALQKSSSLEVELPEELRITVEHPCFDKLDSINENCMVQFHKNNVLRRRPARRRVNAEEIARNAARTGEPCFVCFSEDGEVTGCKLAADGHVICRDCLRMSLRSLAGDILTTTNLLCGCFGFANRGPIMVMAERADESLQRLLANPPTDPGEIVQLEMELEATRQQFGIQAVPDNARGRAATAEEISDAHAGFGRYDDAIPANLYQQKVAAWFDKVQQLTLAPLYHVCSHPDCATKIENWILRTDFDAEYRDRGQLTWVCPAGHSNSVLPTDDEIREANRNILFHPEYYTPSDAYDNCPLRRYRICPGCVRGGSLMIAAHGDGCKQWPGGGGGSRHAHCFCFHCTRDWGNGHNLCGHGRSGCDDPGIQQVRKRADGEGLELGHVDARRYIRWLKQTSEGPCECPPTVFADGSEVDGMERQRALGMTDFRALLEESKEGTR